MRSQSATDVAIGFSEMTCLPALAARIANSGCSAGGVTASSRPQSTRVGHRIDPRCGRLSIRLMIARALKKPVRCELWQRDRRVAEIAAYSGKIR